MFFNMGRKLPFSFLKDSSSSFLNPQTFCKTWCSAGLQFIYVRKLFLKFLHTTFLTFFFLQQKKHPLIDAFFGILFSEFMERRLWITKIISRQEHLSILLIGRGNMLYILYEKLGNAKGRDPYFISRIREGYRVKAGLLIYNQV